MKIFITGNSALIRCVFLENNKIEYFFIEKNPSDIFVGNIYKGRIENILKGLNAAFVNIGEPTNGFIHFDQKEMYFYNEGEEQIPLETNLKDFLPLSALEFHQPLPYLYCKLFLNNHPLQNSLY